MEVSLMAKSRRWARAAIMGIAAATIGLGLAACGGGGGGGGPKIALLLPESKTTRYEAHDHPEFEAAMKNACSDCDLIYSNANQDASQQQSQMEAALTDGADVVVLDPVDSTSAASMVQLAKQQNVPVVSYDRLVLDSPDVNAYVSFDNVKVGQLQGDTLATKLKTDGNPNGPIVRINGSPTDNNAKLFGQGAASAFSQAGVQVAKVSSNQSKSAGTVDSLAVACSVHADVDAGKPSDFLGRRDPWSGPCRVGSCSPSTGRTENSYVERLGCDRQDHVAGRHVVIFHRLDDLPAQHAAKERLPSSVVPRETDLIVVLVIAANHQAGLFVVVLRVERQLRGHFAGERRLPPPDKRGRVLIAERYGRAMEPQDSRDARRATNRSARGLRRKFHARPSSGLSKSSRTGGSSHGMRRQVGGTASRVRLARGCRSWANGRRST